MWKYALLVSYVGTDFCGWQRQKTASELSLEKGMKTSIQLTLETALTQITGEVCSVVGSGRTDSGVHAVGQVAHFSLKNKEWDPWVLYRGLNSQLPQSIRIRAVQRVSPEFHAQRSASKKQYSYYFQQGSSALPHMEPVSWWIHKTLNIEAMNEALSTLIGKHDFKAFQASGSKPGSTVREVLEAEVSRVPMGFPLALSEGALPEDRELALVRVRIVGTGFLKQMVRGISGTLLQIGENRRPPSCFGQILEAKDRSLVGPTAPSRALWLEKVWYSDLDWAFKWHSS